MAPSAKKLEEALLDGTYEVYQVDPEETSVNKVRKHVEEKLSLEDGFFSNEKWKAKSKKIIKQRVEQLFDGWVPEPKQESRLNASTKRQSFELESPTPKRQKRGPKPKKPTKEDASDVEDLSEKENSKSKGKKAKPGPKAKVVELVDEEAIESTVSSPERKGQDNVEAGSDVEEEKPAMDEPKPMELEKQDSSSDDKLSTPPQSSDGSDDEAKVTEKDDEPAPAVNEEDEYSDVIDEPVKPKRKKKEKKDVPAKSSKPKPSKAATKKTSAPDDPNEAEIKKLQSHLVKCGVRKLWHNELKKYGDDPRAKIRHLKKMLTDIGMDGRFSEAKAREIRETRELMAEAEAAQEMNRLWGSGTGGRASRSKSNTLKEENEGSGGEGQDDDEEEEEQQTFAARRRRAQADLAFLGDDSDSD